MNILFWVIKKYSFSNFERYYEIIFFGMMRRPQNKGEKQITIVSSPDWSKLQSPRSNSLLQKNNLLKIFNAELAQMKHAHCLFNQFAFLKIQPQTVSDLNLAKF